MSARSASSIPGLSKGRVESLTDGIFATVMTVLVLSLSVPVIAGSYTTLQLSSEVTKDVLSLVPDMVSYVLSFLILAVMWISHHNFFGFIQRINRNFVWINVILLLTIGFVPFSTALIGRYPEVQVSVIVYGANMFAISIAMQAMMAYATRAELVVPEVSEKRIPGRTMFRWRLGSIIYATGIAVSFLSPIVSFAIYTVALVLFVFSSSIGFSVSVARHEREHHAGVSTA